MAKIGWVEGFGNTMEEQVYTFEDIEALKTNANTLFYRLKQIDFDGRFEFSDIVKINSNCKNEINRNIYPNPAKDRITVKLEDFWNKGRIDVLSIDNRLLLSVPYYREGHKTINLDDLTNGQYLVQIRNDNQVLLQKIILKVE